MAWNSRTISTGTAGRFEPERVDAFLRNGWTISSEYAWRLHEGHKDIWIASKIFNGLTVEVRIKVLDNLQWAISNAWVVKPE